MILNNVLLLKNLTDSVGRKYNKTEIEGQIFKTFFSEFIFINNKTDPTKVNSSNVCCEIDNVHFVDDSLYGDVKVLDTPMGLKVLEYIKKGIAYKFSMRALGFVSDDYEVSGLQIITFDLKLEQWGDLD